jgi:hypothetical protein
MSAKHDGPFFMGVYSDYFEFHKFFPKVLTIYGNLSYHVFNAEGLLLNAEIGPNLLIPTESDDGSDTELLLHYGLATGFRFNPITFKIELAGHFFVTGESENFEDRFIHLLAIGAQWNRGWIRPGIFYQLFLKKGLSDMISGVIGIKLEIDLGK